MDDPFESPKMLVHHAREDLAVLNEQQKAFFDSRPFAPFMRQERKTGMIVHGLRPTAQVPARLRVTVNRLLTDLRHSLDQAVYAAVVTLTDKTNPQKTYFPFASDPDDLKAVFSLRSKDIPLALRPYIEAIQPYPTSKNYAGGNDLLRDLGRFTGPAKHRVSLIVSPGTAGTGFNVQRFKGEGLEVIGRWDESARELLALRHHPGDEVEYDVTPVFFLKLANTGSMSQAPVLGVARDLTRMVERIILGIEAETMSLKG